MNLIVSLEAGEWVIWNKSTYNEWTVTFNDRAAALDFLKSLLLNGE